MISSISKKESICKSSESNISIIIISKIGFLYINLESSILISLNFSFIPIEY